MVVLKQRGIGLLELMLALSIIALLITAATRYYSAAARSSQASVAAEQVLIITKGIEDWYVTRGDLLGLDSISRLTQRGMVPRDFIGKNTNPWQGAIQVSRKGSNTAMIEVEDVPRKACQLLKGLLTEKLDGQCMPMNNKRSVYRGTYQVT